jgi:hypothetical protein
MLEISSDKVAFVILRAREFDAEVTIPNEFSSAIQTEDDVDAILEDHSGNTIPSEVAEFIAGLNEDEQADLVALAWIGRGTYSAEELEEAVAMAKAERTSPTEDYLLGIPLLADYLEAGLDKLGYAIEDIERDVT